MGTQEGSGQIPRAEGTAGLQGRGLSWKERRFSRHCSGRLGPAVYGADSQMGEVNVN